MASRTQPYSIGHIAGKELGPDRPTPDLRQTRRGRLPPNLGGMDAVYIQRGPDVTPSRQGLFLSPSMATLGFLRVFSALRFKPWPVRTWFESGPLLISQN